MASDPRTNLSEAVAAALAGVGEIDDVLTELLDDLGADRGDEVRSRSLKELRSLLHVAAAVGVAEDVDGIIDTALEPARVALGADALSLTRFEAGAGARVLANIGDLGGGLEERPKDETYAIADYEWAWDMISRGRAFFFSASDPDAPAIAADLVRAEEKEHVLMVPVMSATSHELWGDLWATRGAEGEPFDHRSFRVGVAIARLIAGGLERAELFARIAALAHRDELTGLANRRSFEDQLAAALAAGPGPVTVAVCDVDRFKRINDRLGHEAGDEVLMAVATALAAAVGHEAAGEPLAARAGGDEFWVLFAGAPAAAAVALAREVARSLHGSKPGPQLSWGVASSPQSEDAPADLLRRADSALYAAKLAGRGRIRVADPAASGPAGPSRTDRRAVRDAAPISASASLEGVEGGTPEERLAVVASVLTEDIDAAAWLLSEIRDGMIVFDRGWECELDLGSGLRTVRPAAVPPMPVSEFPRTAWAVANQTAYFIDSQSDAKPSELAFLRRYGYEGSITLGIRDADGREFLLELFADSRTAPLEPFVPVLTRLARRAVAPER